MKRFAVLIGALSLAACGTSPEFVDEPEVASTPDPAPAAAPAQNDDLPKVDAAPCGMSTRAVRAQARRGRYTGVEGFDTRTCPPAGRDRP